MSSNPGSTRPTNPWLTKGSKHLFNSSTQRLPSNVNVNPMAVNEISRQSGRRDYFIHPDGKRDQLLTEDVLTTLHTVVSSINMDSDVVTKRDGELVDFSIMKGFDTIGIGNEGNNCYQNSIFQVFESDVVVSHH